jgi:hypothetical protein
MNPGRFFAEVLESHKFRRSDNMKLKRQSMPLSIRLLRPIMQTYWT